MDVRNSAQVKNKVSIGSIVLMLLIYGLIVAFTSWILLIPAGMIMLIAYFICQQHIEAAEGKTMAFKKQYPLSRFGSVEGTFKHIYRYENNLDEKLLNAINNSLAKTLPIGGLKHMEITDIDPDLKHAETREFAQTNSVTTERGSDVTLVTYCSQYGEMQSIQWWVLVAGFASKDKIFRFVVFSPLTIWFWLKSLLNNEFDLLSAIRIRHDAFFDTLDISARVRGLHESVFDALVAELELHGVDISDLVMQRSQLINVQVSGGSVRIGDIVQGAIKRANPTSANRAK